MRVYLFLDFIKAGTIAAVKIIAATASTREFVVTIAVMR